MDAKTRSYLNERKSLSGVFAVERDVVSGLIGAVVGWFVPPNPTPAVSMLFAAGGAVGGVLLVEFILYVWRFVWVAPKKMHLAAWQTIGKLEKELDVARAELRALRLFPVKPHKKRGIAELLEAEPLARAEMARLQPEVDAVLERLATLLVESRSELARMSAAPVDKSLKLTQNRLFYDNHAVKLGAVFSTLEAKVNKLASATSELAEVYVGFVDWATGPRHIKPSLDGKKGQCSADIAKCNENIENINGVISSAHRTFDGQTAALDAAIQAQEIVLRRWLDSVVTLRNAAEMVVSFEKV